MTYVLIFSGHVLVWFTDHISGDTPPPPTCHNCQSASSENKATHVVTLFLCTGTISICIQIVTQSRCLLPNAVIDHHSVKKVLKELDTE